MMRHVLSSLELFGNPFRPKGGGGVFGIIERVSSWFLCFRLHVYFLMLRAFVLGFRPLCLFCFTPP